MVTGFHGLHVIIGTFFLFVCLIRHLKYHFLVEHHFGLEAAIWYWHFVDVIWLLLFVVVYWWGGLFFLRVMSNNRYYKHYLNTILDAVGTKSAIKKFSASYKLMLQKKFNYNFSVFRSSNGIFVYGAAFVLFGAKPDRVISSRSLRSKKRYAIAVVRFKKRTFV